MRQKLPTLLLVLSIFFLADISAQNGQVLSLNGSSAYIRVPDHDKLDIGAGENYTITLWVRTNSNGDFYRMISKRASENGTDPGYEMITQLSGGVYGMNLRTTSGTNSGPPFGVTTITDGNWHHLAMVVNADNSTATIYVDGNQEQQSNVGAIGTQSFANSTDLLVGTEVSENVFFPGFLDEIRIWSVPLTQAEIMADAGTLIDGTEDNLIAAWDFENVTGMDVPDLVGNCNGTLVGGAVASDPNAPMMVSSADLIQRDIPVGMGELDEGIVAINVSTIGNMDPIDLTELTFNLDGTTDMNDISQIKIYYNGNSERFTATNLLGTIAPTAGDMTITGSQTLGEGSNYFWISTDVSANATEGNFLDAEGVSVMVNGATIALETTTEPGGRLIIMEHKLLFSGGDFNSVNWRIPSITTAADGSLVVMADARRDQPGDLPNHIDPVARRSADHGDTWSDAVTVVDFGSTIGAGDVAMLTDKNTGDIIAIFPSHEGFFQSTVNNKQRTQLVRSTDNGITWSDPVEITDMVNLPSWSGAFSSSGSMNQTSSGRIIHGMVVRPDPNNNIDAYMVFSDDGGVTWDVKPNVVSTTGNESKVVELDNGDLMFNLRNGSGLRQIAVSQDGGDTWGTPYLQPEMPEPGVNGDFIRYTSVLDGFDKSRLLFSVASDPNSRRNMTIFLSYDEGQTWGTSKVINPGPAGYSALTVLVDGTIGCFYENGEHEAYQLYFARFSLDWLSDGNDHYLPPVSTAGVFDEKINFQISPNPTWDSAKLTFELEGKMGLKAILTDNSGKFIKVLFDKPFGKGQHLETIDLDGLPVGVFYLQLQSEGQVVSKKLLRVK